MTTELSSEQYEAPSLAEVGNVRSLTQSDRTPSRQSDHYFWAEPKLRFGS